MANKIYMGNLISLYIYGSCVILLNRMYVFLRGMEYV